MEIQNYVYLTINKINGKCYVGSHRTNKTDNYIGSGLYFLKAIKKHGKENFISIKLKQYENILEARKAEEYYIKLFDTQLPNGYNISPKGGHRVEECWSESSKEKMSNSMLGKNTGKTPWNKDMKMSKEFCQKTLNGIIEKRTPTQKIKRSGKTEKREFTEEHKEALRKVHKGKPKTEEHKKAISKSCEGRVQSDITKEKIGKGHLGKKYKKRTISLINN